LCAILDVDAPTAAEALDVAPAALRKRVSRARARIGAFLRAHCGIAQPDNACRCERQVPVAIRAGLVDPARLTLATHPTRTSTARTLQARAQELDELQDEIAVLRAHPDYAAPEALRQRLRHLVSSHRYRVLDA
jgi:hypothetical protein